MLISFDFDDTLLWKELVRDEDGEIEDIVPVGPNPHTMVHLRAALAEGHEVIIVTSRRSTADNTDIEVFLKEHGLDVPVHFTEGSLKCEVLARLGVAVHHDDDLEELQNLPAGCRGCWAPTHPSWL